MRSVDHDGVHSGLYQALTTLCRISPGTNRGRNTEPSLAILTCIRKLGLFLNILDSDKPFQIKGLVYQQYLLYPVLMKQPADILPRGFFRRSHQALAGGHYCGHRLVKTIFKADIPTRDDAGQSTVFIQHRHPRKVFLPYQGYHFADCCEPGNTDRIFNDAALILFDRTYLLRLLGRRHIAMDYPQPARLCQTDGCPRLSHGVHCRRNERNIESNVARKGAGQIDFVRENIRPIRDQQHVVKGECKIWMFHRPIIRFDLNAVNL